MSRLSDCREDLAFYKALAQQRADALIRLGSTEAFKGSRAIDYVRDAELVARIDYARAEVIKYPKRAALTSTNSTTGE